MNKLYYFVIALCVLSIATIASAQDISGERIRNFDVTLSVHDDATIDVLEKIVYDFGDEERHGIFRDIPVRYRVASGNYGVRLDVHAVTDENQVPYEYELLSEGDSKRIKIGDPDALMTGTHTFVISYTVRRALSYFEDHDELWWNVTGNGWNVPIDSVNARITVEPTLTPGQLSERCFVGEYGSTAECATHTIEEQNTVLFEHSSLAPFEGLSIVVSFPTGLIHKPTATETILETAKDNIVIILPFIIFIYLFKRWRRYGKDPEGRKTIIPEYNMPDDLTPAEAGLIVHEQVQKRDITALIIELAVRGYLTITHTKVKKLLFSSDEYTFTKRKAADASLSNHETLLMKALFQKGDTAKLSELKNTLSEEISEIESTIYETVTKKGYFVSNPRNTRILYLVIAFIVFVLGVIAGGYYGFLFSASFILSALFVGIFGWIMPARTVKGVTTREYLLGLKEYLQIAERDRINFHNAPEKNPTLFEKLLPIAMVFGVEKAWAKEFADIYTSQPSWYNDTTGGAFNAIAFTNSLHSFASDSEKSISSTASQGGSGMSGGFSGGGFGGGGGGSW